MAAKIHCENGAVDVAMSLVSVVITIPSVVSLILVSPFSIVTICSIAVGMLILQLCFLVYHYLKWRKYSTIYYGVSPLTLFFKKNFSKDKQDPLNENVNKLAKQAELELHYRQVPVSFAMAFWEMFLYAPETISIIASGSNIPIMGLFSSSLGSFIVNVVSGIYYLYRWNSLANRSTNKSFFKRLSEIFLKKSPPTEPLTDEQIKTEALIKKSIAIVRKDNASGRFFFHLAQALLYLPSGIAIFFTSVSAFTLAIFVAFGVFLLAIALVVYHGYLWYSGGKEAEQINI
jgi:hypothetical protein